jgi:acyl transferase domain-containing protein
VSSGPHPLLEEQVEEGAWETSLVLSSEELRWIPDHEIFRFAVMPGSAYLEIGVAVGAALDGDATQAVANLHLHRAMFCSREEPTRMRVEARRVADGEVAYRVSSLQPDSDDWALNAEGSVVPGGPAPEPLAVGELRRQEREHIDADAHYAEFVNRGAKYGHAHHGVLEVWRRERDSLAVIETPPGIDTDSYSVHPGVLDAAIQIPALHLEDAKGRMWLPIRVDRYQVYRRPPRELLAHAIGYPVDEPRRLLADVLVTDSEGERVAEITGLYAKRGGKK